MHKVHIKRNDIVVAISGKNAIAGKTGKVLEVFKHKGKAVVEGFSLVKKALKKSQDKPQGGFGEKEAPIPVSKLKLFCPACKKGVRIKRAMECKTKVRKCVKCGHGFDA